jgi:hypothetical protein
MAMDKFVRAANSVLNEWEQGGDIALPMHELREGLAPFLRFANEQGRHIS